MSRWADWIFVSVIEGEQLRIAASRGHHDEVRRAIDALLATEESSPTRLGIDKAWEPIHRCLTDDRSPDLDSQAGESPMNQCVLGGAPILEGSRTATLIAADEVLHLAGGLEEIGKSELRASFMALPDALFHAIDDEAFEWVWSEYERLQPFFAAAAERGRAVVCTISW